MTEVTDNHDTPKKLSVTTCNLSVTSDIILNQIHNVGSAISNIVFGGT